MYSGSMMDSKPHGYGISLGTHWAHEGVWEHGVLISGNMINVGTGVKISIPVIPVHEFNSELPIGEVV